MERAAIHFDPNHKSKLYPNSHIGTAKDYYHVACTLMCANIFDIRTQKMLYDSANDGCLSAMLALGILGLKHASLIDFSKSTYGFESFYTGKDRAILYLREAAEHYSSMPITKVFLACALLENPDAASYEEELQDLLRSISYGDFYVWGPTYQLLCKDPSHFYVLSGLMDAA